MKKKVRKIINFGAITFLVSVFALPQPVLANYEDVEMSLGNLVSASSLDAQVSSTQTELQLPATAGDMLAGEIVTRDARIDNVGIENFKYNVAFEKVIGSNTLCSALQLTARRNGAVAYSGNLSAFDFDAPTLDSADHDDWDFSVELPAGSPATLQDLDCDFDFAFTAWQTTFPAPTNGWIDEEEIDNNNIHTGDWTGPVLSAVVDHDPSTTRRTTNRVNIRVTWTTDEAATSKVVYDTVSHVAGTPIDYIFKSPATDDVVADRTSHTQTLGNLNPNNTYYYRVVSRDAVGNESYSIEYSFDISDPVAGTVGNIVMNEFVPDPAGNDVRVKPNGEWIELYNSTLADQDVAGWYFKNSNGDEMVITTANSDNNGNFTDAGETVVPAGRYLVVFVNAEFTPSDFLNNASDTLELYDATDVLMDSYAYVNTFDAGKSFARIPDGGFWVDPDGTPGEENELGSKEMDQYRQEASVCFDGQALKTNAKEAICNLSFLEYLGLLKDKDAREMTDEMYAKLKKEEPKEEVKEEIKEAENNSEIVEEEKIVPTENPIVPETPIEKVEEKTVPVDEPKKEEILKEEEKKKEDEDEQKEEEKVEEKKDDKVEESKKEDKVKEEEKIKEDKEDKTEDAKKEDEVKEEEKVEEKIV